MGPRKAKRDRKENKEQVSDTDCKTGSRQAPALEAMKHALAWPCIDPRGGRGPPYQRGYIGIQQARFPSRHDYFTPV